MPIELKKRMNGTDLYTVEGTVPEQQKEISVKWLVLNGLLTVSGLNVEIDGIGLTKILEN